MEESDAAAIARAQAGDSDGFRVLVDRHSKSLFRLAYRMTGNEADAEDVVQETFLRAYRQLANYESRSSFSTWLYRIAANYALDLIRVRKRKQERHVDSGDQENTLDNFASTDPRQDRLYFNSQLRQRLKSAMDELTDQERTAFVLRHFEGLSIDEIGSILTLGNSATKNSIFRAVRKLRETLEPLVI